MSPASIVEEAEDELAIEEAIEATPVIAHTEGPVAGETLAC